MGPYSVVCIFVVLPVCTDMYTVVFYKIFTYVHVLYALYSVHVLFMLYTAGHVQFCVFISYVLAIVIVFMCVLRHWHLLFPVATGCRFRFACLSGTLFVRDARKVSTPGNKFRSPWWVAIIILAMREHYDGDFRRNGVWRHDGESRMLQPLVVCCFCIKCDQMFSFNGTWKKS